MNHGGIDNKDSKFMFHFKETSDIIECQRAMQIAIPNAFNLSPAVSLRFGYNYSNYKYYLQLLIDIINIFTSKVYQFRLKWQQFGSYQKLKHFLQIMPSLIIFFGNK